MASNTFNEFAGDAANEWDGLSDTAQGYIDSVLETGDATEEASSEMENALEEATAGFKPLNEVAEEAGGTIVETLLGTGEAFSGLSGQMEGNIVGVKDTWSDLADNIDDWTPGSKNIDIYYRYHNKRGDIPGHAAGGIFSSPHLAWIAEGGNPEAVIPLHNGKVPVEWTGGNDGSRRTNSGVGKVIIPIKIVTRDDKELQAETVEITLDELRNRSENNEIVLYAGGVR